MAENNGTAKYQLLTPLVPENYAALETDILNRGVMVAVEVDQDGEILDGHHRAEICGKHGLEYPTVTLTFASETEKRIHVIKINMCRRNMSGIVWGQSFKRLCEERGAAIGSKGGGDPDKHPATVAGCAEELGVPERTARHRVAQAEAYEALPQEQQGAVDDGTKTLKDAAREERREAKAVDRAQRAKDAASATIDDDYGVIVGDFREAGSIIEDESVDMIFTDPPYDREAVGLYAGLAEFAGRVLKPGASLITYFGQYAMLDVAAHLSKHLKFFWPLAIIHVDGPSAQMRHAGIVVKWKPLLWFVKGDRRDKQTFVDDLVESPQPQKGFHDWQQSMAPAEYYIDKLTEPNDLVVDPFCGGGTTPAVCAKLLRRWRSFEINEDSASISRERIKNAISARQSV